MHIGDNSDRYQSRLPSANISLDELAMLEEAIIHASRGEASHYYVYRAIESCFAFQWEGAAPEPENPAIAVRSVEKQ